MILPHGAPNIPALWNLAMNGRKQFVVFTLDAQRYALPLEQVENTVRAVEVTPLPKAPDVVLGVVNVSGRILPVINVRRRCRLPERAIELSDHLVLARTSKRSLALLVDGVCGVVEYPAQDITRAGEIVGGMEFVQGVAKLPDGLILIQDLERFLSLDEERVLQEALSST